MLLSFPVRYMQHICIYIWYSTRTDLARRTPIRSCARWCDATLCGSWEKFLWCQGDQLSTSEAPHIGQGLLQRKAHCEDFRAIPTKEGRKISTVTVKEVTVAATLKARNSMSLVQDLVGYKSRHVAYIYGILVLLKVVGQQLFWNQTPGGPVNGSAHSSVERQVSMLWRPIPPRLQQ